MVSLHPDARHRLRANDEGHGLKAFSLKTALVAGLLVLAGTGAVAESRGSGAITGVSITLIDLDLNDGVAPSISFIAASDPAFAGAYAYGYVRASTSNEDIYREYTRYGATPVSAINGSTSSAWSSASGAVAGASGVGFTSMSVQGEALSGTDVTADYYRGVYYSVVNVMPANFTLSAHTGVVFSVQGWAHGETTLGGNPDSGFSESGGAVLQLSTRGLDANGVDVVWDRQSAAAVAWYTVADDGQVSGATESWQGTLSSGYNNYNAFTVDGQFSAQLSASGQSVAAVVPEPGRVAMLLAGLAGLGLFARGRQKNI